MSKSPYEHHFARYLIERVRDDRAARAVLRRSLGRAPGEAPEAFRYVVPWLPNDCDERREAIYYLVAGLYAYHPEHTPSGNMGDHLRILAGGKEDAFQRLETRMLALLRAHPNDLPNHMRRLIGILKAKEKQPVNWHALMRDLLYWENDKHYVQKRWAASFWGSVHVEETPSPTEEDETDSTIHSRKEEEE